MSAWRCWRSGLARVRRAPALVLLLWTITLVVTIPPAVALYNAVTTQLGASLEANEAADAVNYDWMQEFRAGAGPLGRTLRPDVIGFAAVLDNTSALADADSRPFVVIATGIIFVGLRWFLGPGLINRLAADTPIGARRVLATCGGLLGPMLRLNLLSAAAFAVVFGAFHDWLFEEVFQSVTHDTTVERTAFLVRLACYAALFVVVAAVGLLFDCARVRMVIEGRRSAVASVSAALRFIVGNVGLAGGVYLLNIVAFAAVLAVYAVLSPGGATAWSGFMIGEVYIAARLMVKLAFWAGTASAVQARTAYPGFTRSLDRVA